MSSLTVAAEETRLLCLERGLTLAVAESCTGGLLGGYLTSLAGSSEYFLGGVIAYSDRLKSDLLNVPYPLLQVEGAVSGAVAQSMAQGVAAVTGARCGISITGIAGPSGGTDEKPVGTVWIAVSTPQETVSRRSRFEGNREAVREQAVEAALKLFLDVAGGSRNEV